MEEAPAIRLRAVSKRFANADSPAVTALDLDVESGEVVALVGPSGCGKTTTLRMINRLIEPTEGTIEVLGDDQRSVAPHELRRRIGYVIQQIGLFPHRTVARNIAVVPELLGWDRRQRDERVRELADLVGLAPELLDRYPRALSGGQQQRVGVARALAADPPILLMDEPYSAVDPVVRERLQDELLGLQRKLAKTIVIVTHDIDEALKLGDRVAVMNVGGILEQYDTPDGLLRTPASDFVAGFLGRERGLRRLALRTIADVALQRGPVVDPSTTAIDSAAVAAEHGTGWVAVVDRGALLGWVDGTDLAAAPDGTPVGSLRVQTFVSTVDCNATLREALDVIVRSRTRHVAVVDGGRYVGMGTVDIIAEGLS